METQPFGVKTKSAQFMSFWERWTKLLTRIHQHYQNICQFQPSLTHTGSRKTAVTLRLGPSGFRSWGVGPCSVPTSTVGTKLPHFPTKQTFICVAPLHHSSHAGDTTSGQGSRSGKFYLSNIFSPSSLWMNNYPHSLRHIRSLLNVNEWREQPASNFQKHR